jgi:hypothetical protein
MNTQAAPSLAPRGKLGVSLRRLLLLNFVGFGLFAAPKASSQYSTVQLDISTKFSAATQTAFGQPIATDGTYVAFSTGNALWSQAITGAELRRLYAKGDVLPESDSKVAQIYPQVVVTGGIVVFLATDGGGGSTGLFGLYSIKADGSEPAHRVADSTNVSSTTNWYDDMDPYAYSWVFQASKNVAVIALAGTIYSANLDGTDLKLLWEAEAQGFKGCQTAGTYHTLFLDNSAYLPATNGTAYAFGAGSTLEFEGLYQGALTVANSCDNLINSGISKDDVNTPVKILPGQPIAAGPFAFLNTGQSIQIDGAYVYFGASVPSGVSSTEDYTGYFKIPLKGGKAVAVVTNLSHVPGLTNPGGSYAEVNLMGFAANNGRFLFLAQDTKSNDPAAFYEVKESEFVKVFASGTSVANRCVGALEYGSLAGLNQISLSSEGQLAFPAEEPAVGPDLNGSCASAPYRFQPIGYFVVDTNHALIRTDTAITITASLPLVWGQKPSMKVKVSAAEEASNPKDLVPTGMVTVYFTNPEYFGVQQPHAALPLNADGEATIPLGALEQGTYTYSVAYGGDANFASSASSKLAFPLHVTTPTFSVKPGEYSSPISVYLSDTTPGSTIYYTLNGSTPTTKSKVFSTSIAVSSKETIKAIAVAVGDAQSAVASASYTFK